MPADTDTAAENDRKGKEFSDQHEQEVSRDDQVPGGGAAADDYEATLRRAEEMVDRAAGRIGVVASRLWRRCRRLTARAREEAEDMWAEAQVLRRRETPSDEE